MARILLTNDDGWDAAGLACLKQVADEFGECWVLAPTEPQSGMSHQLTFYRDLQLIQTSARDFHLDGTPADCARVGLTQLGVDFDIVLAGVNEGANLGADIYVSGTVAAAREAWLFGKPAIAFSLYRRGADGHMPAANWPAAGKVVQQVLQQWQSGELSRTIHRPQNPAPPAQMIPDPAAVEFYCQPPADRFLLNVNLPHLETDVDVQQQMADGSLRLVECPTDTNPLPGDYEPLADGQLAYQGKYSRRPRQPGHDIDVCFSGHAALSWLA